MFTRRIFRRRDRQHLWDSSSSSSNSDEEVKQQQQQQISSKRPPIMCSTFEDCPTYKPSTLQPNSLRYSILPAFPTSIYNNQPALLLANVPIHKLDVEQRTRRQPGFYPLIYSIDRNKFDIPSYFRHYYQSFMNSLICQFNVDEAILDYNLYRFLECFQMLANDMIRRHKYPIEQFVLDDKQKQYALEFYLQIDVDLFFMKTCSFRQAKPRSLDEGLFCIDTPQYQYGLLPCNNCSLCVHRYNIACREQLGPMIQFGNKHGFTFYNGYKTILNCPADCFTRNLIYVMVCPCHKYEYVGETSQRLTDRLRYHRQHFNRIFHEFLIGEHNVQLTRMQEKDQETLVKDRMLLYRHATRCPASMQIFLNFNPIYWCFVPLTNTEVEVQNRKHLIIPSSLILLDTVNPTSIGSKDRHAISATVNTRSDESVRSCMRNLPPLPPGYNFSIQQRVKQFQYFKNQHDINHHQNPTLDLFNVAIIAVLPEDVSESVRRFVEALFITHAETKLNTSGRLLHLNDEPNQNMESNSSSSGQTTTTTTITYPMSLEMQAFDREEWCRDLFFPHHQRL